jgi:hypothetical protein
MMLPWIYKEIKFPIQLWNMIKINTYIKIHTKIFIFLTNPGWLHCKKLNLVISYNGNKKI